MMKKNLLILSVLVLFYSCKDGDKDRPDVSNVKVDIEIERFDRDFFSIDSNNLEAGINRLAQKYPRVTPIFIQNILGLDSSILSEGIKRFLRLSQSIDSTVQDVFKNTSDLEEDFENAFRYVNYYFPQYKAPRIITVLGPIDALAQATYGYTPDFLGPDFLGISLQFYLGKNYPLYHDAFFVENVAPLYRSRRFSKEYIIGDAILLIVDDLFPDRSSGKALLHQMVEKGKQWWLMDKFLPDTPDSIKTGYTQAQLDWCKTNEGLIWSYIAANEDLYSVNPVTIQTYIGEGPFTQGFSQELSPGNLGQWIGWRIIQKYVSKNPSIHPKEIMNLDAQIILDGAKYKPK